jgi:hypothetical protein
MLLRPALLLLAAAASLTPAVNAQTSPDADFLFQEPAKPGPTDVPEESIAQEFSVDSSYVGSADMKQGNRDLGDMDEWTVGVNYVISPEITDHILFRGGVDYEHFSFGLPDGAPLPNTLNAYAIILGADVLLSDSWLMRVEIYPGIYHSNGGFEGEGFNMPAIVGASYLYSKDLQFVFGLSVDVEREYPVLPGAGVRWQFADQWVLNFILPRPRLEYQLNKQWQFFVGADVLGGTFRSDKNFGSSVGNFKLNNTPISYWELRAGAGFVFKPIPSISVDVSGGYMVLREFDFHRANTKFDSDGGAPYAQISVRGQF